MEQEQLTRVFDYLENIQAAICVTMGCVVFALALGLMLLILWAHNYDKETKEIADSAKERRLSNQIRSDCQQDTIRILARFENDFKERNKK